jgi:hypothetical protein
MCSSWLIAGTPATLIRSLRVVPTGSLRDQRYQQASCRAQVVAVV